MRSRFEFGNTPARATIEVTSLPGGAQIEYTGVAVRDLKERRAVRPKNMPPSPTASPCVFAGDTLYCSAKSGFIPGANGGVYTSTTAVQLRQTMRNQLDNLEEADMDFCQVVSTTVYLDNLADTPEFDEVYVKVFPRQAAGANNHPADRASGTQLPTKMGTTLIWSRFRSSPSEKTATENHLPLRSSADCNFPRSTVREAAGKS